MAEPIEVVDVIEHQNKYGVQEMVVVDRYPDFTYERRAGLLIGHDSGVFKFYGYEHVDGPSEWKAFGGAKFEIPMADGTVIHAHGQWWDVAPPKDFHGLLYDYGISTIERLEQCNVFRGGVHIDRQIVDEWREKNEPSNNYHKYNRGHPLYGAHRILSKWSNVG